MLRMMKMKNSGIITTLVLMKSTSTQYALLRLMCTHKNPILFKTFDNVKHEKLSLGTDNFVLFTVISERTRSFTQCITQYSYKL